jgi:two-component system chemotaxis response regulator CheY
VNQIAGQLETLKVLIVDDEASMRKVTRALLQAIGIREIYEANDGRAGLEKIRVRAPDIVIVDWEMPSPMDRNSCARRARPAVFRCPTCRSSCSPAIESIRASSKRCASAAMLARIVSILAKPRRMLQQGDYYGPEPRKLASYKPDSDPGFSEIVLVN